MQGWFVDDGDYQKAYLEAISTAPERLGALAAQISAPECIALTAEYLAADKRVLILGQETSGNYHFLDNCSEPERAFAHQVGEYIAFDFGLGVWKKGTPFWQGYMRVCAQFGLSRRAAAWSNIALAQGIGKQVAISGFGGEERKSLSEWQRPLFIEMIRFANPTHIVALTGPNYDQILDEMLPDVQWESTDLPERSLKIGVSEEFGFRIGRTYHPGYLSQSASWDLLEKACSHLQASPSEKRAL